MTDINVDGLGPVDDLVVGFPTEKANFSGEMAAELKALIDSQTIRVLELAMVMKDEADSVVASELRDADDSEVGELRALERDLAILLAEDDIKEIGEALEPGGAAAGAGLGEHVGGPVGLRGAQVGRRVAGRRPDPDPGAHRGGRGGPRGGSERSMKVPLFRERRDRRGLLGGRERRGGRRDDRGDRREDHRDRRPGPGLLGR